MKTPTHLGHKPHIVVDDYHLNDGMYAGSLKTTDARALSIGEAQYDPSHFSAKVFRHTGKKWSRQSEELPLHRVLDLTILILSSQLKGSGARLNSNIGEEIVADDELKELLDYYNQHKTIFDPRLKEIKRLINQLIP